jgi:hypothetical protein
MKCPKHGCKLLIKIDWPQNIAYCPVCTENRINRIKIAELEEKINELTKK